MVADKKEINSSTKKTTAWNKKILTGIVVSTKNKKTIVVKVERKFLHSFYKKNIIRHKNYHAHDDNEVAKNGNKVKIVSCKPISALKRWKLFSIVEKK